VKLAPGFTSASSTPKFLTIILLTLSAMLDIGKLLVVY
jgi:hypothetical protein